MEPMTPEVREELKRLHPGLADDVIDRSQALLNQRFFLDPELDADRIAEIDRQREELIRREMPRYMEAYHPNGHPHNRPISIPPTRVPYWPPQSGAAFVRSRRFLEFLREHARQLSKVDGGPSVVDAVSYVMAWFERKLSEDPAYFEEGPCSSFVGFQLFLKQSLFNAVGETRALLEAHQVIEPPSVERPISATPKLHRRRAEDLLLRLEALPEPDKTVFERLFLEEEDPAYIASVCDLSGADEVARIFVRAVDLMIGRTPRRPRGRRHGVA
jgi:hypothetical protein